MSFPPADCQNLCSLFLPGAFFQHAVKGVCVYIFTQDQILWKVSRRIDL